MTKIDRIRIRRDGDKVPNSTAVITKSQVDQTQFYRRLGLFAGYSVCIAGVVMAYLGLDGYSEVLSSGVMIVIATSGVTYSMSGGSNSTDES